MNILITGATGFVGKNLVAELRNRGDHQIFTVDISTDLSQLKEYLSKCDLIFHLAGVNRASDPEDFERGNVGYTKTILGILEEQHNPCPMIVSSSIQATLATPYGMSKRLMEQEVLSYQERTGAKVYLYRLCNVFGKWCNPNYNSVVATFCHRLTRDLPMWIDSPQHVVELCYIDQVLESFMQSLRGMTQPAPDGFCYIKNTYPITVLDLAQKLNALWEQRTTLVLPSMASGLDKALYSTLLSYLPPDDFAYALAPHHDHRGYFCEFMRSDTFGQIAVVTSQPGVTRGNHYHQSKIEKFLVVKGTGMIRFRNVHDQEVLCYPVSGEVLTPVDIPPGYTHSLENIGNEQLITMIWCNESFDQQRPDTTPLEVLPHA